MSKRSYNILTPQIKLLVEENLKKLSITEISKIFNIHRSTVYKIKNKEHNMHTGKQISYDKKNLHNQAVSAIRKFKKTGTKITSSKILSFIHENVSQRTLQKFLKDDKSFKLKSLQRKIILNESQKEVRLNVIRKWFEDNINFKKICFTDECRFSLDGPDKFISWDLYNDKSTIFRNRRAMYGGSIMIFGAIGFDGNLIIRRLNKSITGKVYEELLKTDIMPILRSRYGNDLIFQNDNARPHTCAIVKKYFKENNVNVLLWPPYSPDLNYIEFVWKKMKNMVYDGQQFKDKEELWIKILKVTDEINDSQPLFIKNLLDGIVKHYLNVIERKGDNK